MLEASHPPLTLVEASAATCVGDGRSFAVIVRTPEEFARWINEPAPGAEWVQVEGLIENPDVWAMAAQGVSSIPVDVVLTNPAKQYAHLYRLTDAHHVRDVRVTMPATPGFMKALRLAASLGLSVRMLPGQPSAEAVAELQAAADFYLHDFVVEAPIEPFHSLLATQRDADSATTLWEICEQDPAIFEHLDAGGNARWPRDFVGKRIAGLVERGAECATCRWQTRCAGYFKWPEPAYSCVEILGLFAHLEDAANEIDRDLAELEQPSTEPVTS